MSKQTASKLPVSGRPNWKYPAGKSSADKDPFRGDATANNSSDVGPHSKNEIPEASKGAKEYRDKRNSNEDGKRFGSFDSSSRTREELSSGRTVPLNFEAKAAVNCCIAPL